MATSRSSDKQAREARERLRVYRARQGVHDQRALRRRRDNVIAVIASLVVVALAVVAQVAFFTTGPGSPEPTPSASAEPAAQVPSPELAEDRIWTGSLTLNDVELEIELDGTAAPQAVAAFVQGTRDDYFVDKTCHRLTDGGFFVLQCGSIDGTGASDPDFSFGPIENAPADNVYSEGTIAMARAGGDADSNGRQFFIVYEDTTIPSDAAGGYTVFGRVTSGLEQLTSDITDGGVVPGSSENDGSPAVPTTISAVTIN